MLVFAKLTKSLAARWGLAGDAPITLTTAVHFDATLIERLAAAHRDLSERLIMLRSGGSTEGMWKDAHECATLLHDLRRNEALWLYPVIAHALSDDPPARGQFLQLRLLLNGNARRVMRRLEELAHAVRSGAGIVAAADNATRAAAEYRERTELELYPLYQIIGASGVASQAA